MKIVSLEYQFGFLAVISCLINSNCSTAGRSLRRVNQYTYSFRAESVGYSDIKSLYTVDSGKTGPSFFRRETIRVLNMNVLCDIKMTKLEQDAKELLLSYEILNPAVSIENDGMPLNAVALAQELTHPVFVELTAQGQIRTVRIDTAVTDMAANLLKEILSRMQFVTRDKDSTTWQTTEQNTTGTFTARYRLLQTNRDSAVYEKIIQEYTKLKSPQKKQRVEIDSRANISTDQSGLVHRISISEAQVVLFNKDTISAVGSKVSASLKSANKAAKTDVTALENLKRSSHYSIESELSTPLSKDQIYRQAYRGTLGNDNWETLILKLNKRETIDKEREDSLVLKFRALAYLFPEDCRRLGTLLRNESYGTRSFRVLSRALSITETSFATDEIAGIIKERKKEEKVLIELLPVLATTGSPTVASAGILKELAFDPGNAPVVITTAQLALGGMANNFRKTDPKQSEELTQFLIQKMEPETDTVQKILVLGNTGSYSVFPFFKSFIENPGVSWAVRVEAVSSLRLIDIPEVGILLNQLLGHKDSSMVNVAREVMAFRKENF